MTIKNKILILFVLLAGFFISCQNEQDEHYNRSGELPDKTLYELMKQDESLSKFTKLIEVAGYDTLLSSSQTLTVWAPVDDALSDVNMTTITKDQARLIVGNHIARFSNSTAIPSGKLIRMANYKIYAYSTGGAAFGGATLLQHDIQAKNGILHTIQSRIPYHYNLYEYAKGMPNTTKLAAFLASFEEERFNEALSIPIDVDDSGRTVYDTVTTFYNRLFDDPDFGLGTINLEDSIFTMLVPTDQAWDAAYNKIYPYFKVYNKNPKIVDSLQRVQTSLAIVNDLIYRGLVNNPSALDTIVSTGESVIRDPAGLFSGATKVSASNGLIYETNDLRYNNTETWDKFIRVEGENTFGRTINVTTTALFTRSVGSASVVPVSNSHYIEIQPTNTTAQPMVTFEIPDVLSGKYDVYVEFIPALIEGNAKDSTKLKFNLSYMNANGATTERPIIANDFVTSGTKKIKMKVLSNFEFPVSNYYDRLWMIDYYEGKNDISSYKFTTKFTIQTNVTQAELNINKFSRKFRVDRIIFESIRKN